MNQANMVYEFGAGRIESMFNKISRGIDTLERFASDGTSIDAGVRGKVSELLEEGFTLQERCIIALDSYKVRQAGSGHSDQKEAQLSVDISRWMQGISIVKSDAISHEFRQKIFLIFSIVILVFVIGFFVIYSDETGTRYMDYSGISNFNYDKINDLYNGGVQGIMRQNWLTVFLFSLCGSIGYLTMSIFIDDFDKFKKLMLISAALSIPVTLVLSTYQAALIYDQIVAQYTKTGDISAKLTDVLNKLSTQNTQKPSEEIKEISGVVSQMLSTLNKSITTDVKNVYLIAMFVMMFLPYFLLFIHGFIIRVLGLNNGQK